MSFYRSSGCRLVDSVVTNTEGNHNPTHVGDNYYQASDNGLAALTSKVAFSALHDAEARYPPPNVLPGTRKIIVRKLRDWCEDSSLQKNRVFWVNGVAGVGKSAIAQALSEHYTRSGELAAAFFFSRNDFTRDKLDPIIATIVHQPVNPRRLKSLLSPLVKHTISSTPGEPCAQVDPRRWVNLPRLVIIDGLDECIEVSSQKRFLKMIQRVTGSLPLNFLVFSRPEPHITRSFRHRSFFPPPHQLALGDFAVRDDIELYLRHEFARIREEHWALLPKPKDTWPGDKVIDTLVWKSTGQFIYVTTVAKFIDKGKVSVTPGQRLEVILTPGPVLNASSPYPDLDQLYTQILQLCGNEGQKLQQALRLIVRTDMGSLLTAFSSTFQLHPSAGLRSAFAIEQLLHLSSGEALALVSGLHSCLDIPGSISENISPLHASFTEFLIDRRRAGTFYVGARLSYQGYMQMLVTSHLRMLLGLVAEFKRATHIAAPNDFHESEPSIGSLNAWRYFYEHHPVIDITNEIVGTLNDFDPHSYFSMLLHWYAINVFVFVFETETQNVYTGFTHTIGLQDTQFSMSFILQLGEEMYKKFKIGDTVRSRLAVK
ncbi:hypothetical protein PQX77_014806 [Marasmius sp. AFHP31]|nr:hypothetical protein PQX77_014806 [Marasmius sp. AFHP31]